jgi:hypothetical protein
MKFWSHYRSERARTIYAEVLRADAERGDSNMRKPKIGDRVAIPTHAVVFVVKSVDEGSETVTLDVTV